MPPPPKHSIYLSKAVSIRKDARGESISIGNSEDSDLHDPTALRADTASTQQGRMQPKENPLQPVIGGGGKWTKRKQESTQPS